jgi:hypothetical protein
MPSSSAAFRELLDGLDPDAFVAFVAALYEARGRETDRADGDILVSDGERTRRFAVRHGAAPSTAAGDIDADAVVVPTVAGDIDTDADTDVIDATRLRRMALYAVDDPDRTRLFQRFFGVDTADVGVADPSPGDRGASDDPVSSGSGVDATRSVADDSFPSQSPPQSATTTADRAQEAEPSAESPGDDPEADGPNRLSARGLLPVVGVLLSVVAVALAVGPGLAGLGFPPVASGGPAGDAAANDTTATAATATAAPTGGPAGASSRDPPPTPSDIEGSADGVEEPYPPGVDADGIENASVLAAAHEATLSGRSYRLSVVDREFLNGQPTAAAWEQTVVEGPTRYRSTVEVAGTFRRQPQAVADATTYADGTERFVRLTNRTDETGTIRFIDRQPDDNATAGGPGWRRTALTPDDDPFATRTAAYLRRTLDAENSALLRAYERNGTRYVWIEFRRQPPNGALTVGSLLVDERGLVHELHYEYAYVSVEEAPVRTTTTVRITRGNVTVSPPPWR